MCFLIKARFSYYFIYNFTRPDDEKPQRREKKQSEKCNEKQTVTSHNT